MAQAFTQAWSYGVKRVMSSYYWETDWQDGKDRNNWIGPPNTNGDTNDVPINPDLSCGGGWMCEHRWRQIFHLVKFGNVVGESPVTNWWDNGNHQIAFSRDGKGFIAINNELDVPLVQFLMTSLPAGTYCDVISGTVFNGTCSGKFVNVATDESAVINIQPMGDDDDDHVPVIAIHIESKL